MEATFRCLRGRLAQVADGREMAKLPCGTRCPPAAKTKVTKTKTALKQETYHLSDLKHDLHCGFVELGGSVSVSS